MLYFCLRDINRYVTIVASEGKDVELVAEYVQPVLVSSAGSHEDTVLASAKAVVALWREDREDSCWVEWLSGPFTKTVRRVKPARLTRIVSETDQPTSIVAMNESIAVAFRPMPMNEFPPDVGRAQVSGTDFPRSGWDVLTADKVTQFPFDVTVLVVSPSLEEAMSTGKTSAQAAHALLALCLRSDEANASVDLTRVVIMQAESQALFDELKVTARAWIRDAGRTEIEPGSITFLAL
jgi:hypothetical protein